MAKRKRGTAHTTATSNAKKRATGSRRAAASSRPRGYKPDPNEYSIRGILAENAKQYHIDWEDNPKTGEKYEPTWEPKEFANAAAVADWEATQVAKEVSKPRAGKKIKAPASPVQNKAPSQELHATARPQKRKASGPPVTDNHQSESLASPARPKRRRTRRVIESSQSTAIEEPAIPETNPEPEIGESPGATAGAAESPLFEPEEPVQSPQRRLEARIQVSDPPSSFHDGAYQRVEPSQVQSESEDQLSAAAANSERQSLPPGHLSIAQTGPDKEPSLTQTQGVLEQSTNEFVVPESQVAHESPSFEGFSPESRVGSTQSIGESQNTTASPNHHGAPIGDFTEAPLATSTSSSEANTAVIASPANTEVINTVTEVRGQSSPSPGKIKLSFKGRTITGQPSIKGAKLLKILSEVPATTAKLPSHVEATLASQRTGATASGSNNTVGQQRALEVSTSRHTNLQEPIAGNTPNTTSGSSKHSESGPCVQSHEALHQQIPAWANIASSWEPSFVATGTKDSRPIIISDQSSSENRTSSGQTNLLDSPQKPDYEHPVAAQPPPPSSVIEGTSIRLPALEQFQAQKESNKGLELAAKSTINAKSGRVPSLQPSLLETGTQDRSIASPSNFPFQTQIPKLGGSSNTSQIIGQQYSPSDSATTSHSESSPFPLVPQQLTDNHSGGRGHRPASRSPYSVSPLQSQSMERSRRETMPEKLARIRAQATAKVRSQRSQGGSSTPAPLSTSAASAIPPALSAELGSYRAATPLSPVLSLSNGARSPSAVPASEPLQKATREDMNTSERYTTLFPQTQDDSLESQERGWNAASSGSTAQNQFQSSEPSIELDNVYAVAIPLVGHQRDEYPQKIKHDRALLEKFLATSNPTAELVASVKQSLESLQQIALHPDLINIETATQYSAESAVKVQWDIDCSAKFRFLKQLLEKLKGQKMHVAIVVDDAKLLDLLDKFLDCLHVSHTNVTATKEVMGAESSPPRTGPALTVSLSSTTSVSHMIGEPDVILSVDGKLDPQGKLVRAMRPRSSTSGHPVCAPLLSLVVPGTIEHIERCLSDSITGDARLRALAGATLRYERQAGKHEVNQVGAQQAADAVAEHLLNPNPGDWPLAELSALTDLDSQTESDLADMSHEEGKSSTPTVAKRPFDADDAVSEISDHNKRARVGPEKPEIITVNPQDLEVTHISDSMGKPTQEQPDADMTSPTMTADAQDAQSLRAALFYTQKRLGQHIEALESLQFKHETQRNELVKVIKLRDAAITTAETAVEKMAKLRDKTSDLVKANENLKQELVAANERLKDHSVPERSEFERQRLALEQAELDKTKAETKTASAESNHEYLRGAYQNASNSAATLAQENAELTEKLTVAQKRAEGEMAKARAISKDTATRSLQRRNQALDKMLQDRELGLKSRDEEITRLKEAGRGRMGTRANSVPPRSPRLGSPIRPGAVGGRASRQASPAVGEVRGRHGAAAAAALHPLRNG